MAQLPALKIERGLGRFSEFIRICPIDQRDPQNRCSICIFRGEQSSWLSSWMRQEMRLTTKRLPPLSRKDRTRKLRHYVQLTTLMLNSVRQNVVFVTQQMLHSKQRLLIYSFSVSYE